MTSGGDVSAIANSGIGSGAGSAVPVAAATGGSPVNAPLAGTVVKVLVQPGQVVAEGEAIIILEAMKMETSVSAPAAGTIVEVRVQAGDNCTVGDVLVTLA